MLQLNRRQTRTTSCWAMPSTGTVTRAFMTPTREAGGWVDAVTRRVARRRARFLWLSERDGWRHLYRVSRDGQRDTDHERSRPT